MHQNLTLACAVTLHRLSFKQNFLKCCFVTGREFSYDGYAVQLGPTKFNQN